MILPLLAPVLPLQTAPPMPRVARRPLPPISAPGTNGWTRAGITPEQLAVRVDTRMGTLKNAICEWIATVNLPTGQGRGFGRNIFFMPGRFQIEVLKFSNVEGDELNKTLWRGENGKVRVFLTDGWQNRANYRSLVSPLAPTFLMNFDDTLMRGTQGAKSISTLVASARKSGFSMVVERRRYRVGNELRLVLSKNSGAIRYAISWREKELLPNQVFVQSVNGKGKLTRILWSCAWGVKKTPLTANDIKNFHPAAGKPNGQ